MTKHSQKTCFLIAMLLLTIFITSQILLPTTKLTAHGSLNPGTAVSGELAGNTTWTSVNSPYLIENTIKVPENVTLTILPGVTVVTQLTTGSMFEINGFIDAKGTIDEPITFDGNGVTFIFKTNHPVSIGFMSLDYCNIRNAQSAFWFDNTAALNMTNSDLTALSQPSYLWYPAQDVYIEYNTFVNSSGISIGTDDYYTNPVGNVTIRYNLFAANQGFFVNNFASYGLSKVNVNNNTFSDINGVVLQVEQGTTTANMDATMNYWGTLDNETVASMIYDMNDDNLCNSYIDYFPLLESPDSEVPLAPTPTPTPTPEPTLTVSPSPSPSMLPTVDPSSTVSPPTTSSPSPFPDASSTSTPSLTPGPSSMLDDSSTTQPTPSSDSSPNADPSSTPAAPEFTTPIMIIFLVSTLVGVTVFKLKKNKTPISQIRVSFRKR